MRTLFLRKCERILRSFPAKFVVLKQIAMTNMINVLRHITPLTDEDAAQILAITESIELEKGDFWIEYGKTNDKVAFVEKGYLRKYYTKEGNEITDFFYFKNDISADLPSIVGNFTPHANIVAMQKTHLTTFDYHAFNELCATNPTLEHLHRLLIQQTFLRFYNRTMSFILETPKQRYEDLLVSDPKIIQGATQYHIASYLGISPQHLSRLRSEQ